MTSAPSRRRLLNGSKPFHSLIAILLLLVFFSACGKKYVPVATIPDFEDPKPVQEEVAPEEVIEVVEETVVEAKKTYFKVAMLLPFNAQHNDLYSLNDTISPKSKTAIEFYSGVKVALSEMHGNNLTLDVKVFDTKNQKEQVDYIVKRLDSYEPDIIIGPVYNKHLAAVSEYALKNEVFIISPLAPASSTVYKNPYYIAMNPSVPIHLEKIYDHVRTKFPSDTIVVISDSTPKEMNRAKQFMAIDDKHAYEYASYGKIKHIPYSSYVWEAHKHRAPGEEKEEPFLKTQFDSLIMSNPVVVTSLNEPFANKILGHLSTVSSSFNFTIYGMPNWPKFKSLNYDQMDMLNLHFTTAFWKDREDKDQNYFFSNYRNRFHTVPSDIAARGYDLMKYLESLLMEHGDRFDEHWEDLESKSVFSKYEFGPGYNQGSVDLMSPDFIENKFLYMATFDNLKFKLVE